MLLTERTTEIKHTQLTPDGDSFKMRVPVLQADVENANKRRYPFAIVKKAVEELKAKLQKRSAFGSTRHEKDLEVDQVSHYVEDIELDDKGVAHAILKILPTQRGRNLAAIIKGGGAVGVSARGFGDVDEKGQVKPGYRLAGVDFTLDPSFSFRVGKECMMFESRTEEEETDPAILAAKGFKTIEEMDKAREQDEEAGLRLKYQVAVRQANFQGSFDEYREALNRPDTDRLVEQRYYDACKNAGFRGTLEQFKEK